ncbi:hypothetical protein [Sphingomonas sanguinis]|jgi:hypothetical protein|nr:hypothetical protein [Sphingomonas sanguinis]
MIQDPEQTTPQPTQNEDDADHSGGGYGNHGEAGEEEQDRREVGG